MACFASVAAVIYNGTDNTISLVLIADGAVLADLSAVTRAVVDIDGTTIIDSDVVGSTVIWWTDSQLYRGQSVNVLRLRLGGQGIAAGAYPDVKITIYDGVNYLNGLRVENPLPWSVVD